MNDLQKKYKYFAFISYNDRDKKRAKWLARKLNNYKLPISYKKRYPNLPGKINVFYDKDHLGIGVLPDELKEAVNDSRYLIIICSPNSAQSKWVEEETRLFKQSNQIENIILVVVSPRSKNTLVECFNKEILSIPKEKELIAANISVSGKHKVFVQIMAYMLGIKYDDFWNVYWLSIIRKRIIRSIVSIIFFLLIISTLYLSIPRHLTISISEKERNNLKFQGAEILLYYGSDTQIAKNITLQEIKEKNYVSFYNIPAYKWLGKARIVFNSYGYNSIDTIVPFTQTVDLNIQRDNTFGLIAGEITDYYTKEPIENVLITILDEEAYTNHKGIFHIKIPLEKQKEEYSVSFYKEGYEKGEFPEVSPSSDWKLHLIPLNQ